MPKVLEIKGFAFYFFAADCQERAHIHIKKGDGGGKVWLEPEVEAFYLRGFKQQWDAYCNH